MPRDPPTGGLISLIVAAALCVKPRGMLTESQKAKVAVLKSSLPSSAATRALAMRFRGMMRSGKADGLEAWLRDAVGSGIYSMRVFEGCRRIWPLFGTRWRRKRQVAKSKDRLTASRL